MVFNMPLNRTFVLITIFICVILICVSYSFNTCLFSNLNQSWKNTQILALLTRTPTIQITRADINHIKLTHSVNQPKQHNDTSVAPKYRQQGLRPYKKLPKFLIIGVKKSGTRALLEFIRLHPDVRAAGSEVHFFDRHYQRGMKWYTRKMPPTIDGQVTIEKTPSYFVTKDVPARVKKMNPNTKLLVVVRDPVTRCISDYTQAASKKKDMKKFEDLAFVNGTVVDSRWGPVKIGVYCKHLENWLKYFPLANFLFISGEKLILDPAAEMNRVQDFLNIKRVVTEKHFYFNSTKGFPCLLKSEERSSPHCLGKTKGRNHPHIDVAAIENLRNFYRPFNEKFYKLCGINFGWA